MTAASRTPLICFVTPGHIGTNPRLVKEAAAAEGAGYRIRVVFSQYMEEHVAADRSILARYARWDSEAVVWLPQPAVRLPLRRRSAFRQRLAALAFDALPVSIAGARALCRVYDELLTAAAKVPADLYVAHNLAALPVAHAAAMHNGAQLAFDAEDFHRGELQPVAGERRRQRLVEWAEQRYMPRCDYVSAASDGIAEAYAAALHISRPTTILNVFPIADLQENVRQDLSERERPAGDRSLYWFSQTIGPERGLEDAVDTLAFLDSDVHLYLRGRWAAGYQQELMNRARLRGVAHRVHRLPLALPHEMVACARVHDVGLALEQPLTVNRSLCVTNKLFTYLTAGIPTVATSTAGQRRIATELGSAVRLYEPGDSRALATAIRDVMADPLARAVARRLATERFNWENERERFLSLVATQVGTPRPSDVAVA